MRVLFLMADSNGGFPVPAVKGGATETLVEHLIKQNQKKQLVDMEIVSFYDKDAVKAAEQYTNCQFHWIRIPVVVKMLDKLLYLIVKHFFKKKKAVSYKTIFSLLYYILCSSHIIKQCQYDKIILENGTIVTDPVGSLSSSFTISAQVILADKDYVRQLNNIFKKVGLEIDGIVPITLAERNLVLDKNELHDNIMLLDIGAGNTDIGVFEGASFLYTNSIPVGGDNITKDIALVLNISEEEADKLKRQYGLALKSFIDNDNDIILNTCKDSNKNKIIKSSELIEIIEARIEEIFSIINKDITKQGLKQKINNVVLTGQGIVNINKSDVAGKINLNIPVKISTGRAISTVKPMYRTSYSLVRYIAARPFTKTVSSSIDTQSNESIVKILLEKIKDFFYS